MIFTSSTMIIGMEYNSFYILYALLFNIVSYFCMWKFRL